MSSKIQNNNTNLQTILDAVNNLPEGSTSTPDYIVTLELTSTDWVETENKTYYKAITIDNTTNYSRIDLNADVETISELNQSGLTFLVENNNGSITIHSIGGLPSKQYIVYATIVETNTDSKTTPIFGDYIGASIVVDQEYSPSSTNAQSGVALASINDKAVEAVKHTVDFVSDDDGVHGIRFTSDHKVKIKDEHEVWTTVVNPYKTYTAIIDETEEDPDLAVSYTDDAKEMEAKSEEWMETDIFKDIRPCLLSDGEVQCYLDPDNYTQQIKNTDPMFYAEDELEVRISDKCSYAEIIEAENALLYDADGNSLPTGRQNANWDIGYGVQGGGDDWDKDRKENITVCYRGDGYMEYKFNVPLAGEYYWFIKFNSQVSNVVRQQEFSINDGEHQIITFPQKGKQFLDTNTYWEQQDSKYVFQFMRQCVKLNQGENSIKVYTPADYWSDTSMVATIEIDYMALTSIDTPDISTGIERESVSHWYLANSTFPSSGLRGGTLNEDNGQKVISYEVTNTTKSESWHAIYVGSTDGTNILSTNSIESHPYLKFYYSCAKASATGSLDLCAYVYLKDGKIARVWGNSPAIKGDGTPSLFSIDLRQGWTGGDILNTTTGYTVEDIDFSRPLIGLLLKPWYGQNRNIGERFDIRGLGFFKENVDDNTLLSSPIVFNTNLYGDVMIEIPKMGYRFKRVGNNVHVSVTRDPEAAGFSYDAFLRGKTLNDYIYIGAYPGTTGTTPDDKGYNFVYQTDINKRMRSLSKSYVSMNPYYYDSVSKISSAKLLAENNNTDSIKGYGLLTYIPYTLLCCLNLLYNKSIRCSKISLEDQPLRTEMTGDFDKNGMYYTDQDKKCNFKFLGLEDISGKNYSTSIDGIKYTRNGGILISCDNLTDENKWMSINAAVPKKPIYYKESIQSTNLLGFLADFEDNGTTSTYYCTYERHDNTWSDNHCQLRDNSNTGIMSFSISTSMEKVSTATLVSNSRLMYSKEE